MNERRTAFKPLASPLSSALRNGLSAYMTTLEEDGRDIERSLDGVHEIFYEFKGALPAPVKNAVRATLSAITDQLLGLKIALKLNTKRLELINIT